MDGRELRLRLDRLRRPHKLPYTEMAVLLGVSPSGLHKQMNGQCSVSRQTERVLELVEDIVEVTRTMLPEQQRETIVNAIRRATHP